MWGYGVLAIVFVLLFYIRYLLRKLHKMEILMENVPGGFFYYSADEEERFEYISPELCQIFGYTEEEFRKVTHNRFSYMIYEPDRAWALEQIDAQIAKDGTNDKVIYRIQDRDGKIHWLDDRGRLITDSRGKRWFYVAVLDITEQRHVQEQMTAAREILRLTLENTDICEFYFYPQEERVENPERTCLHYKVGGICEGIPGKNPYRFLMPKYREKFDVMFKEIKQGEKTATCVVKTKEAQWCRFTLSAITEGPDGLPTYAAGVVENLTEQKNTERENSNLQSIYKFTIENEYDGIGIINLKEDSSELKFSRHFDEKGFRIGMGRKDLWESFSKQFVCEEDRSRFMKETEEDALLKRLDEEGDMLRIFFRGPREEGFRHKEVGLCYFDGTKTRIFACMRDIEEMVEKEEKGRRALLEAYDEAKKANAAKSDFLSKMSHDIRTPMNAIIGMTTIAQSHLEERERIADCLQKIETSSKLLLRLINEILDMSKIESGKVDLTVERFELSGLIDNMLDMIRPSIVEKQQDFKVEIKNLEHTRVIGDPLHIQKVFVNLISNAIKYTPNRGKIKLTVEELPCAQEAVGSYRFVFEDSGIGMTKEFMERLFEPFARAEDSRVSKIEGTGLGMAITKNIVNRMNGDITVESVPSEGSRFTVTLRLKLQEESREAERKNRYRPEAHFFEKKVLLVEDNELNMEIARELLMSMGLDIETAADGREAVEMIVSSPEFYYDMIFMDIQMPVMNGYEAAAAIRALDRRDAGTTPIIAMTANAFVEDVELSINAGMNEHIAKPIELDRLAEVIQKWIK